MSASSDDPADQDPGEDPPQAVVSGASHYVSPTLYIPAESVNPKRPRYAVAASASQWKPIPSSSSQPKPSMLSSESTPSPSANPQPGHGHAAASSSNTASSPSHSPRPSHSGQEANKPSEMEHFPQQHHQFRKGKYVSPVWKPNEMLWLARAWRVQYQGGSSELQGEGGEVTTVTPPGRGKTRADKDREVAEFLNRHGVNRDAKTAGTKWDNMLGEFRKVYEWERGGEREQMGKSYFRLSPYERKIHRLPASFDEQVFEELSQFMGPRMRTPQTTRGGVAQLISTGDALIMPPKSLPPPHPFRDEELSQLPGTITVQLVLASGEGIIHGGTRGMLGFEASMEGGAVGVGASLSSSSSTKQVRRIGKIRMIWEESVSIWAEEGEHHRGRVKLPGSSFLNADELAFLDDSMVASTMETFEDGPLKGFSVDRFISGQHLKVFGRRKPSLPPPTASNERFQLHSMEPSIRSITPWEFQDPTEYYVGCLRVPPPSLPCLFELSWYLQEPPPEELRFPLRKDVYRDLPQGKELFFTTSTELLDCRGISFDVLSSVMRSNPSLCASTSACRDSFIGLWDDCINRIVSKFCSQEMVFIRKSSSSLAETVEDQWPNVTAFIRNFCLWRGEETDQLREGQLDPSSTLVEKIMWTYADVPYVLGYYAVGFVVTFCALSRLQDRIIRTDLYTVDLSTPSERLKALVPCWRIAGVLPLLADRCSVGIGNGYNKVLPYGDFERSDLGNGNIIEMTPNSVVRYFSSRRKWAAIKEIYDFLDHRIPHAEFIVRSSEKDLALVLKPRGCRFRPGNCDQLVEALKHVTKALVALHDLSFMHRDLGWDKVMRRSDREDGEWFVTGFDEAVGAPQINAHGGAAASGRHAPEMGRGLHGVKVDVWGVGQLVKTSGLVGVPKLLRELQNRCLDHNPEQRPTAADCYHHLLQLQSSMSSAASGGY
nr:Kinase superfamily protein isoform 1 [Ipomoea batatas]